MFYNQKTYYRYLKYILIPILGISILIHEYQVLFLGVHLLFTKIKLNNYIETKLILRIYSVLIIPIILVIIFIGNQQIYLDLNNILNKFDVNIHNQLDGGFYKALGGFYKWHFFYFSYNDFINLFLSFLLSLIIPIIIYGNLVEKKIINISSFYKWGHLYFYSPAIICFILALDHGRNISLIATHLITYYLILKIDNKKLKELEKKIYKNINKIILLILFLFFYLFLWKLDQAAGFAFQGKETTIFKSSLFAEFVKLLKLIYFYTDLYLIELPEINL